jgi:opacity protein-like surface antigen
MILNLRPLNLLLLTVLSALSISCLAAETSFTGPSVGVALTAARNKVEYSGYYAGQTSQHTATDAELNASYGFDFGNNVLTAVGLTYALGEPSFGSVVYSAHETTDVKAKQHWSVYLAPGCRFAPQWSAYVKLAYHHLQADTHDTLMGDSTSEHHGWGYGVGLAYAVTNHVEASFEVQQVNLSSASANLSSGKPSFTQATLGAAYRF